MKYVFSGEDRSYLSRLSNRVLARVRKAKDDVKKRYPLVMFSLITSMLGAAVFGIGIAGSVKQRSGGFQFADYEASESIANTAAMYDFMTCAGAGVFAMSILTHIKAISNVKKRKAVLNENIEELSKYLVYENVFVKFLTGENIKVNDFKNYSTEEKLNVVENFMEKQDYSYEYQFGV